MYVSVRDWRTARADPAAAGRRTISSTIILLGLTSLFTDISSEMVAAVLPLFATAQLALSPLAYGLVDGLYQGVSTFVRVGGGMAADGTGRPKAVAVAGYGLSAGCKLALLPVASGATLGLVVAVDRTGKGIRTAPRDALIAASADPGALGRAFGVHRALDTTGALAGPLIAFAVLASIPNGFDHIFVLSFAAAVIGLAILVLLVPNLRTQRQPAARPSLRVVAGLAVRPGLRRLLAVAAVLSMLTIGDGFLYLALQRREDFAAKYFPLLFAGTALVYLLLAIPFGRLADRWGRLGADRPVAGEPRGLPRHPRWQAVPISRPERVGGYVRRLGSLLCHRRQSRKNVAGRGQPGGSRAAHDPGERRVSLRGPRRDPDRLQASGRPGAVAVARARPDHRARRRAGRVPQCRRSGGVAGRRSDPVRASPRRQRGDRRVGGASRRNRVSRRVHPLRMVAVGGALSSPLTPGFSPVIG